MEGWWAASYVALWLLVIVLAVIVVALARQIGTLYLRIGPRGALEMDAEGPALGSTAPQVDLTALDGSRVRIGGAGRVQLLLFVSPGCHICEQVLPAVGALRQLGVSPVVVSDNDAEETALVYGRKRIDAPIVPGIGVTGAYEIPGTPFVVIVDDDGLVKAKGTVNNLEQIEGLVQTFRARRAGPLEHAS